MFKGAHIALVAGISAAVINPHVSAQDLNLNGVDDANEFGLPVPGSYGPEFVEDFESIGLPSGWTISGLWNVTSLTCYWCSQRSATTASATPTTTAIQM